MSFPSPNPPENHTVPALGAWNPTRTTQFRNGLWGVRAGDGKLIGAWALDFAVVILLSGACALVVLAKNGGTAAIMAGIACWVVVSWVYGFCCANGYTLGTLAAGTRLVKLRDGRAPGFWRSGWLMFLRTALFPAWLVVIIFALLGAGDPNVASKRDFHVSIDKQQTSALQAAPMSGH